MEENLNESLLRNIRFAYNEALEFIVALGMVACEDQIHSIAEDYKIEMDPLALSFHEEARARLSPHTSREMQFFFGYNFLNKALDFAFYESVCSSPEPQSAEDWISRLECSPANKVISEMVYGVYKDKLEEFLQGEDWEVVKHDLSILTGLARTTVPTQEINQAQAPLLECLSYPEECKQRYLLLLRQFHKDVFIHWQDRLRERSVEASAHYEAQFTAGPERFIREINKNEPSLYTDIPTTFHVSLISQVGNHFLSLYNGNSVVGWVIFGINNERVYGPAADRERIELFFKAFSDKRRLDFVLLLKQRPHYGQEIASALGITPAAVNYHANFLFFLDLIRFKREDHRLYYHLNTDKLQGLLALTAQIMLNEN